MNKMTSCRWDLLVTYADSPACCFLTSPANAPASLSYEDRFCLEACFSPSAQHEKIIKKPERQGEGMDGIIILKRGSKCAIKY
jgi:hypothetical protein